MTHKVDVFAYQLDSEIMVSKVKIIRVGFVSRMSDGTLLIHNWGFAPMTTKEGGNFTAKQLRKISEDFYGDALLKIYEQQSPYGLWCSSYMEIMRKRKGSK